MHNSISCFTWNVISYLFVFSLSNLLVHKWIFSIVYAVIICCIDIFVCVIFNLFLIFFIDWVKWHALHKLFLKLKINRQKFIVQICSGNPALERKTACVGWQQGESLWPWFRALESFSEGWESFGERVEIWNSHSSWWASQVSSHAKIVHLVFIFAARIFWPVGCLCLMKGCNWKYS